MFVLFNIASYSQFIGMHLIRFLVETSAWQKSVDEKGKINKIGNKIRTVIK